MFNNLTDRLTTSIKRLRGLGRLTKENIQLTLCDIRSALIEADVAVVVVKDFLEHVQEKALGKEVISNIRPGEALVKVVQDELTHLLGDELAKINLNTQPPIVILIIGLQGSGKTTTVAKLARWLHKVQKKSVMVTSVDVYRPAAMQQLETLVAPINVYCFPTSSNQSPVKIAKSALKQAQKQLIDVLILDTAGRLHIDNVLMKEIKVISKTIAPIETLLVADSMMGQDAANVAKSFNNMLSLTGVVLTKLDADMRGGAALSIRMITKKPIKFVSRGEKIDAFEPFYPDRMASRILGMSDIISLVEEAQYKVNQKQTAKIAKKLQKGKRFDCNDFLTQLQQMKKIGGIQSLLNKLPGINQVPKGTSTFLYDKLLVKIQAIIQSMTLKERRFPALINGSRKRRISKGSGTSLQDVNKLLKQFTHMQKMMKRMQGDKMVKRIKKIQGKIPDNLLNRILLR